MKKSTLYILIALTLALGAAMVACGGGGKKSSNEQAQPTAEQQNNGNNNQQQEATPENNSNDNGSSGSLADVPVYPGATKITSGEWSGSEAGIPAIGNLNPSDYSNAQYAIYQTNDAPEDVFNWYKDHMSDWNQEGSFSSGSGSDYGAYALWSKDDGKTAAWIIVGSSDNQTSLSIWVGSQ